MAHNFVNPFPGLAYEMAWGPWGGTHHRGQNWQSGSAWDVLLKKGQPMVAPIDGKVVSAGDGGSGRYAGKKIGIQGKDYSVFLTHLGSLSVRKGDYVFAGDPIGTSGEAAGVEHVHVAMGGPNYFNYSDSNGIDPRSFLQDTSAYLAAKGPNGYPWYRGNYVPKQPHEGVKLTLKERLMAAWFGGKSADVVIERLRSGYQGEIPNPWDSRMFRQLRAAGFGPRSARRVVKTLRKRRKK